MTAPAMPEHRWCLCADRDVKQDNKKRAGEHSPAGIPDEDQPCLSTAMTAAAKIHVCSRAAAMAVAWAAMGEAGAAAVGHRAPAVGGAAVAVATDNDSLTKDAGATGAAGVGEAAAGGAAVVVTAAAVVSVGSGRSHDSETGGDGQESDDLFHDVWSRFDCFVSDLLPHHLQLWDQTRALRVYSRAIQIFSFYLTEPESTNLKIR